MSNNIKTARKRTYFCRWEFIPPWYLILFSFNRTNHRQYRSAVELSSYLQRRTRKNLERQKYREDLPSLMKLTTRNVCSNFSVSVSGSNTSTWSAWDRGFCSTRAGNSVVLSSFSSVLYFAVHTSSSTCVVIANKFSVPLFPTHPFLHPSLLPLLIHDSAHQ